MIIQWVQQMESFDLIIIGAGSAGCMAAFKAAKEGLNKIALIDRKRKDLIGRKICGDGIGTKHLFFLQSKGFPIRQNNVKLNSIKKVHIVAPDPSVKRVISIVGQLSIIDRLKFGQTLLETAISKEAVKLFDNTMLRNIKRKNGEVTVNLRNKSKEFSIKAPLVIDASGFNSKIRDGLDHFKKHARAANTEQYYCYREICEIPNMPSHYKDAAIFEFSHEKTRGGYMWFFSRGNNQCNMGNGVPKYWLKEISPKRNYMESMISRFSDVKVIDGGGGFVPTRHPIPNHVDDNIILVGDAGLVVNPLHGGGLSPSIASGYKAGKLAADAITNETLTKQDLWPFNFQLIERYGKRYSILDLYRLFLQNIPDKELTHAIENDYLPIDKVFYARKYKKLMKLSRQLALIWKDIPNPRFSLLPQAIEEIYALTNNYPEEATSIDEWSLKYRAIYDKYQSEIRKLIIKKQ
ncbi:MAG: geranylgeranyl reductase family protein [Asgard group archaeon]|nr:geranylgeranyl reductase family protein [Asgard group archaeon]